MEISGLVLAGLGLLLLLLLSFNKPALPKGVKRSRGIILSTYAAANAPGGSLTVRFTAGKETHTASFSSADAQLFFPGQQVLIDYDPEQPGVLLEVNSVSAALGKSFLGMLLAALLIIGGLLLIRLG